MKNTIATLAGVFLLGSSLAAHASTFTYTIGGAGVTGTITITTGGLDPDQTKAPGSYDITAATGIVNGDAFHFVYEPGVTFDNPDPFFYDNVLFPSSPLLFDNNGLSLMFEDGDPYAGIYSQNGAINLFDPGNFNQNVTLTPVVASTPEPSSFVLLGTGILGVAGAARRKFLRA